MVDESDLLNGFTEKSGVEKSSFEVITENRYLNGQRSGFKYILVSQNDRVEIVLSDTIENRIYEAKVDAEAIQEAFRYQKIELREKLLKNKISEY
jgi:hypothetical protein